MFFMGLSACLPLLLTAADCIRKEDHIQAATGGYTDLTLIHREAHMPHTPAPLSSVPKGRVFSTLPEPEGEDAC